MRWNNLLGDLAVNVTAGSSGHANSPFVAVHKRRYWHKADIPRLTSICPLLGQSGHALMVGGAIDPNRT
jgi:hypothetical protein